MKGKGSEASIHINAVGGDASGYLTHAFASRLLGGREVCISTDGDVGAHINDAGFGACGQIKAPKRASSVISRGAANKEHSISQYVEITRAPELEASGSGSLAGVAFSGCIGAHRKQGTFYR